MANTLLGALTSKALMPVSNPLPSRGGWLPVVREPFAGAWQRNMELGRDTLLSQATVFACMTLIAGDIAKLPWGLRERVGRVWQEVSNSAYSPVLRRPNHYQNNQQFRETWMLSKLMYGNTLALKVRDARGVVKELKILNWRFVEPLVTELGEVYYRINKDALSEIFEEEVVVPSSEVIHDRFNTFFHPLIGLSPLYAAASVAGHALEIQNSTTRFFGNGARPGGILVAPGAISEANAKELKDKWETNFSGANAGKVAVLGDGLKYETMQMTSTDAQLIEQLKWDAEEIARCFHVPAYKVGVGTAPTYGNYQALNLDYYTTCLQPLMEAMEWCLQDGLSLADGLEVHIDTGELLRMDSKTQMEIATSGIQGRVFTSNEARELFNYGAVAGGGNIYAQMQDVPLDSLGKAPPPPVVEPPAPAPAVDDQKALLEGFRKSLGLD